MLISKTPNFLKWLYPSLIWSYPEEGKKLYLTFDDGPIPEITPWILDELKKYNAKATFFCVGENVNKYPAIFQRILDEKHQVGNHSYNHIKGWKTSFDTYINNIEKASCLIHTNLMRPPYGQITRKQIQFLSKKYKIIMWSVLSVDYNPRVNPETCLSNVTNHTKSGSIIVFHDNVKAINNLKFILPRILKKYKEAGFSFEIIKDDKRK